MPVDFEPRMRRIFSGATLRGTMPYGTGGLTEGQTITRQIRRAALQTEAFNQVTATVPNAPRRLRRKAARAAVSAALKAGIFPQFTKDEVSPEAATQVLSDSKH